jgi:hypothetical protein
MNAVQEELPAAPLSEADQHQVREQMNRLLETHHFKNSRRYPALLRFIVEETLAGRGEFLKERLLGIRVFDRPADYDTATDPIVRVTIAEIRKRIAQYYHDEEHDAEIRIELLPGRYMPEFRARREAAVERAVVDATEKMPPLGRVVPVVQMPLPDVPVVVPPATRKGFSRRLLYALISVAVVLLGAGSFAGFHWLKPTAVDQFWAPVLRSQQAELLCIPADAGKKIAPSSPSLVGGSTAAAAKTAKSPDYTYLGYESLAENVVYSDMLAALDIANVLTTRHHDYRVRLNAATTLEDLHDGPAVLIGGLDNQWTMRALAPLRYHFAGNDADRYWIADSTRPNFRDWSLDLKLPYAAVMRDYAIIARLHNEETGQPEVIVAGIGMSGTAAAGYFVADEDRLKEVRQQIGAQRFKNSDFEVLLGADVVNGIAGSPKVLAVYAW